MKVVYQAYDGRIFETEEECRAYDELLVALDTALIFYKDERGEDRYFIGFDKDYFNEVFDEAASVRIIDPEKVKRINNHFDFYERYRLPEECGFYVWEVTEDSWDRGDCSLYNFTWVKKGE